MVIVYIHVRNIILVPIESLKMVFNTFMALAALSILVSTNNQTGLPTLCKIAFFVAYVRELDSCFSLHIKVHS